MSEIERFQRDQGGAGIIEALYRDGAAIIEGAVGAPVMDKLQAELDHHFAEKPIGGGAFFGGACKRLGGVLGKAPAFADVIADPQLLSLADAVLLQNCKTYRIQLASSLQVWKGGKLQPLHRDTGVYGPYFLPKPSDPQIMLSMIWAATDFTVENGATRLAMGSHKWDPDHEVTADDIAYAAMPRGSMVIWLGSVLHGMGINTTDQPRTGVVSAFTVGWLRQEENQYIACSPEVVASLPEKVQQLAGYQAHSQTLGWVDGRDGKLLLRAGERDLDAAGYDDQPLQNAST